MNIKKLFSLFMIVIVVLTSNINCCASKPYKVKIPDTDIPGASDKPTRSWSKSVKMSQEIASESGDLPNISIAIQGEPEELNRRLDELNRDYEYFLDQLEVASEERQKLEDDVLCTSCISCKMSDKAVSEMRGNINETPPSFIFRSKRFYKGVIVGAVIVTVVLTGAYVYMHFIKK